MKINLNLLILFLLPLGSAAQSIKLRSFTTTDGLANDNVYAAAQDSRGFLWFATDFGISYFDGYQFTNYSKKDGINNTAIIDIAYAGGDSMVFISNPKTIQSIHENGTIRTLMANTGISLHQICRHENTFYFIHRHDPNLVILGNGIVTKCTADSVLQFPGIKINAVFSIREQGVGFCTNKGFFIKQGNSIKRFLPNTDVQNGIYTKKKEILLVAGKDILILEPPFEIKQTENRLPENFSPYHLEENGDGIWIRNIDKGVYLFQNNKLVPMDAALDLKETTINEFLTDHDGNLWINTNGKGVLLKMQSDFKNYNISSGLPNNVVISLNKRKNQLLIGTENGIGIYENKEIRKMQLPSSKEGLKYTYQILQTPDGKTGLNIGKTFAFGDTGNFKHFMQINKEMIAYNSMFVWPESDRHFWTFEDITSHLLYKIDNSNSIIEKVDLSAFNILRIYKMIYWEGRYWLGTNNGYVQFNNLILKYSDSVNNEKTGEVFDFLIDRQNTLWMATANGLFHVVHGTFIPVTKSKTALGNYCKALTIDNTGTIWCATWDGIFSYDGNTKQNFNIQNGLASKITNCILYDSVENCLHIGTSNGFDTWIPDRQIANANDKQVFIQLTTNDSSNTAVSENSSLGATKNQFRFYLNIPFYNREIPVVYEYKLDEGEWIATREPNGIISNLKSGKHIFYARAKINDQLISNTESNIRFSIKTPFYKTWWFITIAVLLSQLLAFAAINHFNKKSKEKKLHLMQKDAEFAALKQKAFTALLNPHFIFNALNSIQMFINKNDRQNANKYLSDFASLIRKNFDSAQEAFINLEDELVAIRLYIQLEQMRFSQGFQYTIDIEESLDTEDWMIPSLVLQPLLENAILHGIMQLPEKGEVWIGIRKIKNDLQITIEDNGIGIEKSKALKTDTKHKSKGMHLIRERLSILSKITKEPLTFTVADAHPGSQNCGTRITLTIPPDLYKEFEKHSASVKDLS